MATQVRISQNPCQAQAHLYSTMKVIILLSFKRREKQCCCCKEWKQMRGGTNLGNAQKMSFFFSAQAKFSILAVNIQNNEKFEKKPSKTVLPKFCLFQWGQYLPGSPLISFSVNFIVSHNITFYGKPINPTHNSIQFQQISRATILLYFLTNFSTTGVHI